MKEKLKLIKADLKVWNRTVFGNLEEHIETKKREGEILDRADDVMGLEEGEIVKRNQCTTELTRSLIWRDSLLFQKAKMK